MTTNEIIQYLKDNKYNCVAFKGMPSEVREWCRKSSGCLQFLDTSGSWNPAVFGKPGENFVYCLSPDYTPEYLGDITLPVDDKGFVEVPWLGTKRHFTSFVGKYIRNCSGVLTCFKYLVYPGYGCAQDVCGISPTTKNFVFARTPWEALAIPKSVVVFRCKTKE